MVSRGADTGVTSPGSWSQVPLSDLQVDTFGLQTFGPSHFSLFDTGQRGKEGTHLCPHALIFPKVRIRLGEDLPLNDIYFAFFHPVVLCKSLQEVMKT